MILDSNRFNFVFVKEAKFNGEIGKNIGNGLDAGNESFRFDPNFEFPVIRTSFREWSGLVDKSQYQQSHYLCDGWFISLWWCTYTQLKRRRHGLN